MPCFGIVVILVIKIPLHNPSKPNKTPGKVQHIFISSVTLADKDMLHFLFGFGLAVHKPGYWVICLFVRRNLTVLTFRLRLWGKKQRLRKHGACFGNKRSGETWADTKVAQFVSSYSSSISSWCFNPLWPVGAAAGAWVLTLFWLQTTH